MHHLPRVHLIALVLVLCRSVCSYCSASCCVYKHVPWQWMYIVLIYSVGYGRGVNPVASAMCIMLHIYTLRTSIPLASVEIPMHLMAMCYNCRLQ